MLTGSLKIGCGLEAVNQGLYNNQEAARSIINHYVTVEIADKLPPEELSEEKIRERYEREKDKIFVPEMVQISRIVIKDENEARSLVNELKKRPDTFESTAKTKTIPREKARSGKIGWVTARGKGDVTKEVAITALALKDGQVSDAIEAPIGWQIIEREAYKPKETYSYERPNQNQTTDDTRKGRIDDNAERPSFSVGTHRHCRLEALELKGPQKQMLNH